VQEKEALSRGIVVAFGKTVRIRPPTQSRASTKPIVNFAEHSVSAAAKPATPAPIISPSVVSVVIAFGAYQGRIQICPQWLIVNISRSG
jgi:hypothetical protein